MRTYHPESWSVQARQRADLLMSQMDEEWTEEYIVLRFCTPEYTAPLIAHRMAKRIGRKMREQKRKETR